MESLISFCIFVFVIIVCIISSKLVPPDGTGKGCCSDNVQTLKNNMKVNGVDINLTNAEIDKLKRKNADAEYKKFIIAKDRLIDSIKKDADNTDDLIRRKVLEGIINYKIDTQEDLDRIIFLYNNGNLRTNQEVEEYDHFVSNVQNRENFDKERHKVNILAFFIPFTATIIIACIALDNVLFLPVALMFALLAGFIGMMIGYSININKAKEYGIPDNDPRVEKEKLKQKSGAISGVVGAVSIGKHSKQAVKDIMNVDSWSEMK